MKIPIQLLNLKYSILSLFALENLEEGRKQQYQGAGERDPHPRSGSGCCAAADSLAAYRVVACFWARLTPASQLQKGYQQGLREGALSPAEGALWPPRPLRRPQAAAWPI